MAEASDVDVAATFDPFSEHVQRDPESWYRRMRALGPVHHAPVVDAWFVVQRDAVLEALRQPDVFSNRMGSAIRPMHPEARPEVEAIRAEGWPEVPVLLYEDPPEHTRQRSLFNKAFTPRRVRAIEPEIRDMAESLTDGLLARGRCEFVSDFAVPLPIHVIASVLEIPHERHADFKRWSDARSTNVGNRRDPADEVRCAHAELERQRYFAGELEARTEEPRGDFLTAMVEARIDDEELTMAEMLCILGQLLNAGNETTTRLLAGMMAVVARNHDLWEWLAEDPEGRLPGFVDESLRVLTPVQGLPRIVTREVDLAGTTIPEGATAYLMYASANLDEAAFDDAPRFDPTRAEAGSHLSFGHGPHFCLGASLARLEAVAAFRALLARAEPPVLVDDRLRYTPSFLLRGLEELHLAMAPKGAS